MIVFNQVLLPEDEEVWPKWCATFTGETGIAPVAVFVAPHDRRAAESLALPFFERPWPHSVSVGTRLPRPACPWRMFFRGFDSTTSNSEPCKGVVPRRAFRRRAAPLSSTP